MTILARRKLATIYADANPGVNDDVTFGVLIGMLWFNTSNGKYWKCLDNTDGAASWEEIGSGGGGSIAVGDGSTTVDPTSTLTFDSDFFAVSDEGAGEARVTFIGSPGGSGPLRQVANSLFSTPISTSSSSYVDSGLGCSFGSNLASTGSKVRIRVTIGIISASTLSTPIFTLFRGATDLTPGGVSGLAGETIDSANYRRQITFEFVDSPGSVTPGTYKLYWKTNSGTAYLNQSQDGSQTAVSTMVIEEIV